MESLRLEAIEGRALEAPLTEVGPYAVALRGTRHSMLIAHAERSTVVVDEQGTDLPIGATGLLAFEAPEGFGPTYHQDPDKTAKAMVVLSSVPKNVLRFATRSKKLCWRLLVHVKMQAISQVALSV